MTNKYNLYLKRFKVVLHTVGNYFLLHPSFGYFKSLFYAIRSKKLLVTLFWCCLVSVLIGNPHFQFKQKGWTNASINDVIQDEEGFLWIASWSGLARYDGYALKRYFQEPNQLNQLKDNKITCLFKDSKGRIWVGTNYSGFYQYSKKLDGFIQYSHHPNKINSLSDNHVSTILEDEQGYIWVGTENGLNRFDPTTANFIHFKNQENSERSLSDNFVYSLAMDTDHHLWIGTETGLNRMVRNNQGEPAYFINYSLAPKVVSQDDYLRHNFIYKIVPSTSLDNTLWIGTSIGLKKVTYQEKNLTDIDCQHFYQWESELDKEKHLSHRFVADILEDSSYLWIATHDGLNYYHIPTSTFTHYRYNEQQSASINNNFIKTLFKDRFGLLWIGTDRGLNQLNLNTSGFYHLPFSNQVRSDNSKLSNIAKAVTKKGLWVGANGGGMRFIETQQPFQESKVYTYQLQSGLVSDLANFISQIIVDESGFLWMGTHGAGILKIKESSIPTKSGTVVIPTQFTKENQLSDDYVMTLQESKNDAIWIGYWSDGLSRYDKTTQQFTHFRHTHNLSFDLTSFPIVSLCETIEKGQTILWASARAGGLLKLKYDQKQNELYLLKQYRSDAANSISSNFTNKLFQNDPDFLWIATENGLNRLNLQEESFDYFYEEKSSNGNRFILAITSDQEGQIWFSSSTGISVIQQNETVKTFDHYDGLKDHYFHQSGMTLEDGRLIFGGNSGLNFFHPSSILKDTIAPKVDFINLYLSNQLIEPRKEIKGRIILPNDISLIKRLELSHQENDFSIEFAGLQFNKPEKTTYAYRMEGFEEDWIYANSNQRIAHYTNLPYNNFKFQVKAANADGVWSEISTLSIYIQPPFWLSKPAYFLYFLSFLGLLLLVRRVTRIRTEYRHSLQLEKLKREQLESVNKAKLEFFTNISHELKTPLTLIVSPLEQFIRQKQGNKQLQKVFSRMYSNANRLLTMINQLLDIRKSEAGLLRLNSAQNNIVKFSKDCITAFEEFARKNEIQIQFHTSSKKIMLWYDSIHLEKVFFNLLSNAIKFTPKGGTIEVSIEDNSQTASVLISIKDSGIGIPMEHIPHIFNRFYQVNNQPSPNKLAGSGIGLALTKEIIVLHNGSIRVESTEATGTTFYIRLPQAVPSIPSTASTNSSTNTSLDNFLQADLSEENIPLASLDTASNKATLNKEVTILLVEDNIDIRTYLKENIQAYYKVMEASDGKEGLSLAINNPPGLIVADIAMPNMDGLELCRQLKENIHTSHIPVILLTARTSLLYKLNGLEFGADDYITKPFNMRLLQARIDNLITSRAKLRQQFSNNFDLSPTGVPMCKLDEDLLKRVKTIITKHLDDSSFSVEQLAQNLHMSRMQLYRKLKALTDQTPKVIIRNIRLQKAVKLLQDGRYNVSDVTYMVGYNDLQSFREQFRKEYGMNPSQFSSEEL